MATAHSSTCLEDLIDGFELTRTNLGAILERVQARYACVPRDVLRVLARRMRLPLGEVCRLARSEGRFQLDPRGRQVVEVCDGSSCASRGSGRLYEEALRVTSADRGGTSADGEFTIQHALCSGRCLEGPVVTINRTAYIAVEPGHIALVIGQHRPVSGEERIASSSP